MKHLFVPYELALLAKENGFDEDCLAYWELFDNSWNGYGAWGGITVLYEEDDLRLILTVNELKSYYRNLIKAPLYQQLIDWFREKHKIDVRVFPMYEQEDSYKTCWGWNITELEWGIDKEHHIANSVSTREYGLSYYEALTIALTKAFKLIP